MTEAAVYVRKLAIFRKIVHREDKVDVKNLNIIMVPVGEELQVEESAPSPQRYTV
jgi:ribosomal protein S17